eukprot:881835-Prymnesium_polylepis.2
MRPCGGVFEELTLACRAALQLRARVRVPLDPALHAAKAPSEHRAPECLLSGPEAHLAARGTQPQQLTHAALLEHEQLEFGRELEQRAGLQRGATGPLRQRRIVGVQRACTTAPHREQ